ncbi:MAG: superoxide dismutase family protein [Lachnospiraceae bacterium]|nr:superoxide dismutase family protein [Lachnospiraceae bacterium]
MYTDQITPRINFLQNLIYERPDATAWVAGNAANPQLSGLVKFYRTSYGGILVEAEIFGLPNIKEQGSSDFYAMHIHEFGNCSDDFQRTGEHYNPSGRPHPYHAGDLLPLLGNQGYAWSAFYDKRFTIEEIIGKSVIIHSGHDDFTSQPSGNSGAKIGCGEIRRTI